MENNHCIVDGQDEGQLWEKYAKGKNHVIRNYFFLKYTPLVKSIAGKVYKEMPQNIEFDDLISYGFFGLFDAITKFDPNRGIKFTTYAAIRIRGAMFDELRLIDWVPRSVKAKAKKVKAIKSELENKLGRTAENDELAKEIGITKKEFQELLNIASGTLMLSLNDILYSGYDNEISILDSLKAPQDTNPDILAEKEEIIDYVINAIKKLPVREKKVIVLYYYENLIMKEIGEILGVKEARVSQIHSAAIKRLRKILKRDFSKDWLN